MRTAVAAAVACFILVGITSGKDAAAALRRTTNIEAQGLGSALQALARQRDIQVVYRSEIVGDRKTTGAAGDLTLEEALSELLRGTQLTYRYLDDRAITIVAVPNAASDAFPPRGTAGVDAASASADDAGSSAEVARSASLWNRFRLARATSGKPDEPGTGAVEEYSPAARGVPEILVRGSRSLNLDIERTPDDVQPYVVFDKDTIEKSGARSIDELLRQKLSSNSSPLSRSQNAPDNRSLINLRGLGFQQTLILIDGHRVAAPNGNGTAGQPDLNGIPLAAVERIEVLPTTASGIYGGGATGGVVNVVLRRDYSGIETRLTYDNSFDGGGATRRIDFAAGFNLEGGKTNLMFAGSYSDGTDLLGRDRDFQQRGRATAIANDPASFFDAPVPPLGATTNIRSADGSNLVLNSALGGTELLSPFTSVPDGYQGVASDAAAALVANSGIYNLALANTVQPTGGANYALLNTPKIESVNGTVRREFAPWLSAFLDLSWSKNSGSFAKNDLSGFFYLPAGAPANPFAQDIYVTTPALGADAQTSSPYHDERATGGVIFRLPLRWQGNLQYTWDRSRYSGVNPGASLTPDADVAVSEGTLDIFRDTNAFPTDFGQFLPAAQFIVPTHATLKDAELRLSGPLGFELPGGAPTLTFMLANRQEALDDYSVVDPTFTVLAYSRSQAADSAYLELRLPIAGPDNAWKGIHLLELQLAGRRDEYDLVGANLTVFSPGDDPEPPTRVTRHLSSTDPTLGLRFQPTPDLTVRGSYGTGFLPPALFQFVPGATRQGNGGGRLTDPRRGDEPIGAFQILTGGNPELRSEESESRSAGIILTPRWAPALRLSIDWTQIEKHDNVRTFAIVQENIDNEASIPGFITRGAPSGGFDVGPIAQFNSRYLNVVRQTVEAVDFSASYRMQTDSFGTFDVTAAATRNLHNVTQVIETLPETESLGLPATLEWQGSARLDWSYRQWSLGWAMRYTDSYWLLSDHSIYPGQGSATVPSQTYHDLDARYRFADTGNASSFVGRLQSGLEINAGIRNIFDKRPPFEVTGLQYYSSYADPRISSYYLTISKSFF